VKFSGNPESGMSLIELMVALGIFVVVLMSLGGLMYEIAQGSQKSALATYRAAASQHATAWIRGLDFDSLSTAVGCTADTTGVLVYNRCITVANASTNRKTVTVVIQPTGDLITNPDTQVVERTTTIGSSALVVQ
jgi:prepilin-type N-terminal cleavage/methylation domain-containing protein